jgi:2-methylaconitate cis-trans-isomerase PrpF
MAFVDPAGSVTGRLLPTGKAVDTLEVAGMGQVEASLVDAANPVVFVRATDVGLTGAETGDEIDAAPGVLDRLERIRCAGAVAMGISDSAEQAASNSLAVPKIAIVAPPRTYQSASGAAIGGDEVDLLARILSLQRAHRSYALTGAIATAAAAAVPGSVVAEAAGQARREGGRLRIGHPAGTMALEVVSAPLNGSAQIVKVIAERTARRLMEGSVFVPARIFARAEQTHGRLA